MEEQNEERLQAEEREWLDRVKRLEKIKEEQFQEISNDCEMRISEMRSNFQKKEQLIAEEMHARLKALLAEKDKNSTEKMIELQCENEQFRREIVDLNKIIQVKESLINVISKKKGSEM